MHGAFGCRFQSEVFPNPIRCLFESVPFLGKWSPFFFDLPYPVVTTGRITPIFGTIRDHPEPIIWVSYKWTKKQLTCCNESMWPQ